MGAQGHGHFAPELARLLPALPTRTLANRTCPGRSFSFVWDFQKTLLCFFVSPLMFLMSIITKHPPNMMTKQRYEYAPYKRTGRMALRKRVEHVPRATSQGVMKPTHAAHTPHASTKVARPRMMLVAIWLGLYWVFSSFFDHYIKRVEVIDFRLFRATELAFAIRPKDGVIQSSVPCSGARYYLGCSSFFDNYVQSPAQLSRGLSIIIVYSLVKL